MGVVANEAKAIMIFRQYKEVLKEDGPEAAQGFRINISEGPVGDLVKEKIAKHQSQSQE